MWQWLADNQAVAWLAAALILIGADMFMGMDMWLIMFGAGALVGAGAVAVGVGTPLALLIAALVALLLLTLVRPPVLKKLHAGPELKHEQVSDLVGRHARAIEAIDDAHGQVQFDGVLWTARPYLEETRIPAGTPIEVLSVDELTVLVHPVDAPLTDPLADIDRLSNQNNQARQGYQSNRSNDRSQNNSAGPRSDRSAPDDDGPGSSSDARQADNPKEG